MKFVISKEKRYYIFLKLDIDFEAKQKTLIQTEVHFNFIIG